MNIGIYYAYWEKEWGGDFLPYIKKVKDLGFDILEVTCASFYKEDDDNYFINMKKLAEDNGMIITGGYGPDAAHDISSDDPAVVRAALDKYEDMFRKMELAGITSLGGGLYSYWPIDFSKPFDKQAAWERSVTNMRKMADMAADHGITTLGMEALNRFEGYLINTAEECCAYVDEVGKPNVKVMLDTFHMNIEEDSIPDAIRMAGSRLGHFHAGEANRRPPKAGGRIDWSGIAQALKDIDYQGSIVMEPFVLKDGQVGKDIHIWRDMSKGAPISKLDEDARASAAFMHSLF